MIATSKKIRFTVDEYFRMSAAGVFDGKRVELIEGRVVRMHAEGHPHRWCVTKLMLTLQRHFPVDAYWALAQSTLVLGRHGAPDPDVHVFAASGGTPEHQLPLPFLVIEVSDTTYRRDSGIKLRQYAAAGIADYWIVNLKARRIEVYRKPASRTDETPARYEERTDFVPGQTISLLARPNVQLAVDDILP